MSEILAEREGTAGKRFTDGEALGISRERATHADGSLF